MTTALANMMNLGSRRATLTVSRSQGPFNPGPQRQMGKSRPAEEMRVVTITQIGGEPSDSTQYRRWPLPSYSRNELLVRVKAASLNPIDCRMRKGMVVSPQPPYIPGRDFSGVVVATGPEVWEFNEGDEVFGVVGTDSRGSWSEFITVPENQVALKPKKKTHVEAAAYPFVSMTASVVMGHMEAYGIEPPAGVFFNGGAGAVGTIAVQLLKQRGFRVGVSCAPRDIERMRSYGVDFVVDYTQPSGLSAVELSTTDRFDVFVDGVGSGEPLAPRFLHTHKNNLFLQMHPPIESGETQMSSFEAVKKAMSIVWKTKVRSGFSKSGFEYVLTRIPSLDVRKVLSRVSNLVDSGSPPLDLPIARVFPLGEAAEAQDLWESGQARGKIVLDLDR